MSSSALEAAVEAGDAAAAKRAVDALVGPEEPGAGGAGGAPPLAAAASALRRLVAALKALPHTPAANDLIEDVAGRAVERVAMAYARAQRAGGGGGGQDVSSPLDEPDYSLRYLLYQVHMASSDYLRAAGVLALARVETALGSDEAKAEAYVKVAQAYLKAEDDINADAYAKRALPHVFKEGVSWLVQVQYKAIVAQVLDAKKQFLQAALRYADLSRLPTAQMQEGDLLAMLEKAARCAILSPAGPPRQRVMAALCRDERVLEGLIDPRTGNLLERMFTERFVAPADAQSFEGTLEAHQRAVTSDGSTIFQKALLEHNMAAAQRVYAAIAFPALAKRLGIEPARAEGIAAKMINEGRLRAMIDQLGAEGGMLVFGGGGAEAAPGEDGEDGGGGGGGAGAGARGEDSVDALLRWDGKIKDLCMAINQTTDSVAKAFPAIVPEELRPKEAFA